MLSGLRFNLCFFRFHSGFFQQPFTGHTHYLFTEGTSQEAYADEQDVGLGVMFLKFQSPAEKENCSRGTSESSGKVAHNAQTYLPVLGFSNFVVTRPWRRVG